MGLGVREGTFTQRIMGGRGGGDTHTKNKEIGGREADGQTGVF